MLRALLQIHLAIAERHVVTGEKHVVQQHDLIARLRSRGLDTALAESFLKDLRSCLELFRTIRGIDRRRMNQTSGCLIRYCRMPRCRKAPM